MLEVGLRRRGNRVGVARVQHIFCIALGVSASSRWLNIFSVCVKVDNTVALTQEVRLVLNPVGVSGHNSFRQYAQHKYSE